MKKYFILVAFGILFLLVASFHVYMNKVAKDDFSNYLTKNSLSLNVSYQDFKRNLFGEIKINNIIIKNVPNNNFSYSIDEIKIEKDIEGEKKFEINNLRFNIYDYLKSKKMKKEDLWDISRKFDIEDDFLVNPLFSLASIGFNDIVLNLKGSVKYNKVGEETYLKIFISIKDFGDIILISNLVNIPKNYPDMVSDFVKSLDLLKLGDDISLNTFYLSFVDKSFMKKAYKHITTYSYEDIEADDFDRISFLKINELSKKFKDVGFNEKDSENYAKNIALSYNQNRKIIIISRKNEGFSFEKINETKNIFNFLHLIKSDIYVSDEIKSKFISLN